MDAIFYVSAFFTFYALHCDLLIMIIHDHKFTVSSKMMIDVVYNKILLFNIRLYYFVFYKVWIKVFLKDLFTYYSFLSIVKLTFSRYKLDFSIIIFFWFFFLRVFFYYRILTSYFFSTDISFLLMLILFFVINK